MLILNINVRYLFWKFRSFFFLRRCWEIVRFNNGFENFQQLINFIIMIILRRYLWRHNARSDIISPEPKVKKKKLKWKFFNIQLGGYSYEYC